MVRPWPLEMNPLRSSSSSRRDPTVRFCMPFFVRSMDIAAPVLEVVLVGSLEDPAVRACLEATIALQYERGVPNVLVDATAVTRGMTIPEVIALSDLLAEAKVPTHWRQAVVRPRNVEAAVTVDLWAVTVTNRGMIATMFDDRESALSWLIEA